SRSRARRRVNWTGSLAPLEMPHAPMGEDRTIVETIVVVGGGIAGGRAVEVLRKEGFEGRLVLVGAEAELPSARPPPSQEYLQSELPEEKLFPRPATFFAEQAVEPLLGTPATALDPAAHTLMLAGGRSLVYDKLLIVTGAAPRRLEVPGADLEGAVYLRTL